MLLTRIVVKMILELACRIAALVQIIDKLSRILTDSPKSVYILRKLIRESIFGIEFESYHPF